MQEEVVHHQDVLRGEVILGREALAHRRGLGVVLEEVEGDEGRGKRREVVLVELRAHHAQLEQVLVGAHVELVVRPLRNERVGHAHRVEVGGAGLAAAQPTGAVLQVGHLVRVRGEG